MTRGASRRRHWVRWTLLLAVVLLGAVAVVTALQARTAYTHLRAVEDQAPHVREQVRAGDADGLRRTVVALRQDTRAAKQAVDGWQWTLLGKLPWVGADFHAVQAVGEAAHELTTGALTHLVDASREVGLKDLQPVDGRFDTAPLRAAQSDLTASARSAQAADDLLADVHPSKLLGRLQGPVTEATDNVAALRSATGTAARASRLLPDVLGASGPRDYLLLVENNAEPRALGGIAGSLILLHTENGRVKLVETRPASSFKPLPRPVLDLSPGESGLFGSQLGRFAQNVTGTPDFPRAAQLASALWTQKTKTRLDGVAAIDPVALGALLRATGPVRLATGQELTEQNAAKTLLNQVYFDVTDVEAQDRFFGAAAASIFTRLTSGPMDVMTAMDVLSQMTGEGRFHFWSGSEQDQRQVAGTPVAGELRGRDGDTPVLGVYLHDRTQGKVAYYEDMDVQVTPKSCRASGPDFYTLTVTLGSQVPGNVKDMGTQTGLGKIVPVGQLASQVYVYAPQGGFFLSSRVSSGDTPISRVKHDGLDAIGQQVTLRPGETVTLEYVVQVPENPSGAIEVRSTPGPEIGRFEVTTTPCTP